MFKDRDPPPTILTATTKLHHSTARQDLVFFLQTPLDRATALHIPFHLFLTFATTSQKTQSICISNDSQIQISRCWMTNDFIQSFIKL